MEDVPSYGEVHGEAVYLLDEGHGAPSRRPRRCATTATGSSRSRTPRPLPRRAGRGRRRRGAAGDRRAEARRRRPRPGIRTGDKGSAATAPARTHEPGLRHRREADRARGGTQGHLTGAAISRFGFEGGSRRSGHSASKRSGGPEAARAHRPHDGLAAPQERQVRRVRRLLHLPDGAGPGLARLRGRPRVPRRRVLGPRRARSS